MTMDLDLEPAGAFRAHLPDITSERFTSMREKKDVHAYTQDMLATRNPPWLYALYQHWAKLAEESYFGITNDGIRREGLFQLQDEGVPIEQITVAADRLLTHLTPTQRAATVLHLDAPDWRYWSNPEFLFRNMGIRLDEVDREIRLQVLQLLSRTLSKKGMNKVENTMRINQFLGELVDTPHILNKSSYNFVMFGEPDLNRPWGWLLYGHHLCLSIFLYKRQIVISPWFTGAEPNLIDMGLWQGTSILVDEEILGLKLMQSLDPRQQKQAQIYEQMKDPRMPHGRWNHDDQRHLLGAYRDNRVVPYEGILVSEMSEDCQVIVLDIFEAYLCYLPDQARKMRLESVRSWFHETYWCWIGGFGDDDPFYYRLQSPVIIVEFDHHSGVFLENKEPAKFHIHTLLRTPNGGDYGMALRPLIPKLEQNFVWEG